MVLRRALVAAVALTVCLSPPAYGDPFATSDQNPLLAGAGLPQPFAARIASHAANSVVVTLNWASSAASQDNAQEILTMDAESREWSLSIGQAINERLAVRFTLPYRSYSGGTLDNLIDEWHSLGFSEGDRKQQPQDRLLIDYARSNQSTLSFARSEGSWGDIAADLGWQMTDTPTSASALWGTIKLPTGNANRLSGNEAFGGSLTIAHERRLSSRWDAYAQAGATY
ncbi:MAG TPA: DUF3187 family protein, partial [Steroidobacteraceae bacterium]|nr:DUF3187 family protein [Steroidobacteraceae bacterium]